MCQRKTYVTNSRPFRDGTETWRRRACKACGFIFTTYEEYNYRDISVLKRSGAPEPFSRDKLLLSINLATQKPSTAVELTKTVMAKLDLSKPEIESKLLAKLITETLKSFSAAAHARYNSYQLEK